MKEETGRQIKESEGRMKEEMGRQITESEGRMKGIDGL